MRSRRFRIDGWWAWGRAWRLLAIALLALLGGSMQRAAVSEALGGPYVVLAWNDLGMHCYNKDFAYLGVLPPYNTLWAQVIRRGNPPQIVTGGVRVTYGFAGNTFSVGKTNFWTYDLALFGVDLPANTGLTGKGLSGTMDAHGDYFVAEGIPLTEFSDSDYAANPASPAPHPYQVATVTVWDLNTGAKLAETHPVAPVSSEMRCINCHSDGQQEDIATGIVEKNILRLHDREHQSEYPAGHTGSLEARAPVLCAECHASNALGAPGVTGLPNLSRAMHEGHDEAVANTLAGCYQCHPGPQTQCLRDVMSQQFGMTCTDCHGGMSQVGSEGRDPWLDEPRCDSVGCHASPAFAYPANLLYRQASGHGGVYCAGCHDSPHAIAPSREANDAIKFIEWQGYAGAVRTCTVCHTVMPEVAGPHGISLEASYLPLVVH